MVILDTNVVSEIVKVAPDPRVLKWVDDQPFDSIYVTAITKMELLYGIEILPMGKRRADLSDKYERLFKTWFLGRVLPFDDTSASHCAWLSASAFKRGRGYSTEDLQISAIAFQYRCPVVTRDVNDFDHEGVQCINPWTD